MTSGNGQAKKAVVVKVISLRGVSDNLHRRLKVLASASGMGFRDYCVAVLERHVQERSRGADRIRTLFTPMEDDADRVESV